MRGLPLTIQPWLNPNYSPICILSYRIPRIIARGDYFFFRTLFSHHITLTLDREGIKGKYLMSTCILFLLPFSRALSKVWILLLKKPNSYWSRVNAWVNFWYNDNFLCKSESYWSPTKSIQLHRLATTRKHHNNEFQNSDRPSILLKLKKKKEKKKKHLCFHTTPLPTTYYCTSVAPRMESDQSKDLY